MKTLERFLLHFNAGALKRWKLVYYVILAGIARQIRLERICIYP